MTNNILFQEWTIRWTVIPFYVRKRHEENITHAWRNITLTIEQTIQKEEKDCMKNRHRDIFFIPLLKGFKILLKGFGFLFRNAMWKSLVTFTKEKL